MSQGLRRCDRAGHSQDRHAKTPPRPHMNGLLTHQVNEGHDGHHVQEELVGHAVVPKHIPPVQHSHLGEGLWWHGYIVSQQARDGDV